MGTITVMTSQVKKGDRFQRKDYWQLCDSDAYLHKGIWTVDIDGKYRYGWQSIDTEIEVIRKHQNLYLASLIIDFVGDVLFNNFDVNF